MDVREMTPFEKWMTDKGINFSRVTEDDVKGLIRQLQEAGIEADGQTDFGTLEGNN